MDDTQAELTIEQKVKLEQELVAFCNANPDGVRQDQLQEALINNYKGSNKYTLFNIAFAINSLTNKGRLAVFRHENICVWKSVAEDKANKLAGLTQQERIVYNAIERENNKGIWIKDLRKRTNITGQNVLEKLLKGLQARKLIKAEESVAGKNKKVYMLYDLKPSLEVTGGTWYRGHDMDTEFINTMQRASKLIIRKYGPQTARQVMQRLRDVKISTVDFTLNDVACVLGTLVMDRELEHVSHMHLPSQTLRDEYNARQQRRANAADAQEELSKLAEYGNSRKKRRIDNSDSDSDDDDAVVELQSTVDAGRESDDEEEADDDDEVEKVYKLANGGDYVKENMFVSPCIGCPLVDRCRPGNIIEPQSCHYFTQWLAEDF